MLQHRGQDSAGVVTGDGPRFHEHKANGLVSDVFKDQSTIDGLAGSVGLGHVRYPTAGTASAAEAQPFFVNSPLGIYLIHNGNLTNADELRAMLEGSASFFSRHLRTQSDSEVRGAESARGGGGAAPCRLAPAAAPTRAPLLPRSCSTCLPTRSTARTSAACRPRRATRL